MYIDDLVDAFLAGLENIDALSGKAFNIGGGPPYTISLMDLLHLISRISPARLQFGLNPGAGPISATTFQTLAVLGRLPDGIAMSVSPKGVGRLKRWLIESGATSRTLPAIHGGAAS